MIGVIESDSAWKGYAPFLAALNALPESEKAGIFVRIASRAEVGLPDGIESERLKPTGDAQMAEFYRGCDIFVFTSFIEGFGLPPLEAMACGVPVLTTDCGGIREYANDKNAMIVPPGNVCGTDRRNSASKQEVGFARKLAQFPASKPRRVIRWTPCLKNISRGWRRCENPCPDPLRGVRRQQPRPVPINSCPHWKRRVSMSRSRLFLAMTILRRLYGGQGRGAAPIIAAYGRRLTQLFAARKYDLLWIEKELLPWLPASVETFLSRTGTRFVVDYDDATFHNYDENRRAIMCAACLERKLTG